MTFKNSFFPSCLVLFLSVSFFSCKRNSTGDFFRNSIYAREKEKAVITADTFSLFRGTGLVIVRSTGEPGNIIVEVRSEGLEPDSVSLEAY